MLFLGIELDMYVRAVYGRTHFSLIYGNINQHLAPTK